MSILKNNKNKHVEFEVKSVPDDYDDEERK